MDDFKNSKLCFWEVPGKWLDKMFIFVEKKGTNKRLMLFALVDFILQWWILQTFISVATKFSSLPYSYLLHLKTIIPTAWQC